MPNFGASGRPNPFVWTGEEAPAGVFVGQEPELQLLGLPQGSARRKAPRIERVDGSSPAQRLLLAEATVSLARISAGEAAQTVFPLAPLSREDRTALLDLLGEGEVTGLVASDQLHQVSETNFPGLWLVAPEDGAPWLEVGDAPALVRKAAEGVRRRWLPLEHMVPPDGTMNVMGVLSEVRTAARDWRLGQANLVMNFTLLPMTEADADFLAAVLDRGPVQLSSGGYGSARVLATGLQRVWAVQFLNSMGAVILDTLEIGDLPQAACAQRQDLEDSAKRLSDLLKGGFA